ncbi:hypothetical protein [Bifidobacterium callitrichos]|uniref:Phage protein n=1 Tax=Bifidobacterium callitrichos DSM 23973 TaxID=1437609 RepID=A0A086ZVM2_9BIFI|nr:hypothetical protein [Bifidobacterium callitrichos]KFI50572.1 phage protein [Bifidobacterium callitrichos DSM 23973]
MRGETITVIRRVQSGVDEGNNPVYEEQRETVPNVLVDSPDSTDAGDSNRPDGMRVDAVFRFPRDYTGDPLDGCRIILRGDEAHPYHVVGHPLPLDGGMQPTKWNMSVEATYTEG